MYGHSPPTILVVEDEALVRITAAAILEEAGWSVVEAVDAAEALNALNAHAEVDVLFTDVKMPGEMDGIELAARVHELRPAVQILVTSGHMLLAKEDLPEGGTFIGKPYDYERLVQAVSAKLLQLPLSSS